MATARSGAIILLLNFVAAISCIMVNRRLMKPPLSFQMPIFITLIGYSSSVLGLVVCRQMGMLTRLSSRGGNRRGLGRHGKPLYSPWSLIATTALAPVMANYSLLFNSVGVYQLSKVLVTPSIIIFDRWHGAAPLSAERLMCLIIVSLGVTIVTVGDVSVNWPGLLVATCNIAIAGYYKVEWSHTCRTKKLTSLELMTAVMPKATAMLAVLAIVIEGQRLGSFDWKNAIEDHAIIRLLVLCGVTAFFTSWSGYVVISNLSALTHQLLGQAKTCIILLAGYIFFSSPLSATQGYGALLAMSAMVAYTKFTMNDAQKGRLSQGILPLHKPAVAIGSSAISTGSTYYPLSPSSGNAATEPAAIRPPSWPRVAGVKRRGRDETFII